MTTTDNSRADALTDDEVLNLFSEAVGHPHASNRKMLETWGRFFRYDDLIKAVRTLLALRPVEQHEAAPAGELASMTRMFHAACHDLGLINEALGLDPDDGGAEPILDAIAELKAERDKWVDANYAHAPAPLEGTGNGADERAANPIGYIRDLIANDAYAMSFQTMGKYRTALLAALNAPATTGSRDTFDAFFEHYVDPAFDVDREWLFRMVQCWTAWPRAPRTEVAGAVAWVRKHPGTGELSGDWLWNDTIEQCRKDSGVWFPLGFLTAPQPPSADAAAAPADWQRALPQIPDLVKSMAWLTMCLRTELSRLDDTTHKALDEVEAQLCCVRAITNGAIDYEAMVARAAASQPAAETFSLISGAVDPTVVDELIRDMQPAAAAGQEAVTIPAGWKFSVTESDGRIWLGIDSPCGSGCALSAAAYIDEGRGSTIAAQILRTLALDLTSAPPAQVATRQLTDERRENVHMALNYLRACGGFDTEVKVLRALLEGAKQ